MLSNIDFREVDARTYETYLATHPNLSSVDTDRDYTNLDCYLSPGNNIGYCIKRDNRELKLVFCHPQVKGLGKHAVWDAISKGARQLDCFDGKLREYYERFGFVVYKREKNWTEGGPDVVYMHLAEPC